MISHKKPNCSCLPILAKPTTSVTIINILPWLPVLLSHNQQHSLPFFLPAADIKHSRAIFQVSGT